MSYVLCLVSYVLFNTSWAFCPACFIVLLDASCLMSVNLSCIQDTEDTRFMQPWWTLDRSNSAHSVHYTYKFALCIVQGALSSY